MIFVCSYLVNAINALLCGSELHNRVLFDCDSICSVFKQQFVCSHHFCNFSKFIPDKHPSYGHVLHLYVREVCIARNLRSIYEIKQILNLNLCRVGGLVGGNLVGLLVENNCSMIFYVFAVLSISKCIHDWRKKAPLYQYYIFVS